MYIWSLFKTDLSSATISNVVDSWLFRSRFKPTSWSRC